jgi:SWI/SNF-related matrix-associated actin-dependent regulator of chromatin subfamily A member 5
MDNLDVEESNKRPYEDDFLENGEEDGVGYSADTSVGVPTPILSPSAVVAKRPAAKKGAKKQKKIKVKFGASSNPGAHGERQELERRRDNFLRAHAKVYLALLPPKNAIANLFTASNKNKVHHESVPYRVVTQPKSIVGGTLKDYQLAGVSFMAYMYENGQNCILADE